MTTLAMPYKHMNPGRRERHVARATGWRLREPDTDRIEQLVAMVMRWLPPWLKSFIVRTAVALGVWSVEGSAQARITAIILGVVTIVIGLIVAGIVDSQAASSGGAAEIGSFAGAKAMNDLLPLIIRVVVLMVGVGMIGIGSAGFMRVGPMRA